MSMSKRKEKLLQRLRDKEHRDAFVSAQIDIGIPFQIRALREQRPETQSELAGRIGMAQAWISKLENPNYSGFSLATLKKIASAFDVGLAVRFVPISQLVEWELNLSNNSLPVPSFEDDPYFKESDADGPELSKLTSGQGQCSKVVSIASYQSQAFKRSVGTLAPSMRQDDPLSKRAGAVQ
jgi:transcriptional regulator with XRE-family HTH domain